MNHFAGAGEAALRWQSSCSSSMAATPFHFACNCLHKQEAAAMGLGETPDTHLSITLQALRLQLLGTHLQEVARVLRQQQGWEMHRLQG